jgi:hypothetical protein
MLFFHAPESRLQPARPPDHRWKLLAVVGRAATEWPHPSLRLILATFFKKSKKKKKKKKQATYY